MFAVEWMENGKHKWENAFTEMGLELIIEKLIALGIKKFSVEVVED